MLKRLIIAGAGGFGREILSWARSSIQFRKEWEIEGFIDDDLSSLNGMRTGAPLIGRIQDYEPKPNDVFICAIGNPSVKRRVTESLMARGAIFTRLVHFTAIVADNVHLGAGVILCPYSVVSANVTVGVGVAVNLHSTIDHDSVVGDWTQINCHCDITGGVEVGVEVFFGSSVSVIPNIHIGDRAYLGAGAVVIRDVPVGAKMVGVPARQVISME